MARGNLRVYLGAAPGVGKTFAMLNEGRRRHDRGTDVVVGFVETHGQARTISRWRDGRGAPNSNNLLMGTAARDASNSVLSGSYKENRLVAHGVFGANVVSVPIRALSGFVCANAVQARRSIARCLSRDPPLHFPGKRIGHESRSLHSKRLRPSFRQRKASFRRRTVVAEHSQLDLIPIHR